MSNDLVAALTLQLRDQMSGGIGELKGVFESLTGTLNSLNGTMGELRDVMATMRGPTQVVSDLKAVQTQAEATATTVKTSMAETAASITKSMATATATATADLAALRADWARSVSAPSFIPPELAPPSFIPPNRPDEPEPVPGQPARPGSPKPEPTGSHGSGNVLQDFIAVATGYEAFKMYADFDQAARQITVVEGLSGAAASKEADTVEGFTNLLALKYANSSSDLMSAYAYLITDHFSKGQVDQLMPSLAIASTAYHVPADQIAPSVYALGANFDIQPDETLHGLAILHRASQLGHFGIGDFGNYLPELSGQAQLVGMTGIQGESQVAAALETIQKNNGDNTEASATQLRELFMYLHSPMGLRMFDMTTKMQDLLGPAGRDLLNKYGVTPLDLPKYLNTQRAAGVDELTAMTNYFNTILAKISSPTDGADIIGDFLHNQGAQSAMIALTAHSDQFTDIKNQLGQMTDATVVRDFNTALEGAGSELTLFDENMSQAGRDIGSMFNYFVAWPARNLFSPPALVGGIGTNNSYTPLPGFVPGYGGPSLAPPAPQVTVNNNIKVDKSGNVTQTQTVTTTPAAAPAAARGPVLNRP